jgi:succinate-acetate transporter protein
MTTGNAPSIPLEKDFSNGYTNGNHQHLDANMNHDEALKRIQTAGSISISPELFEKIYLSPQNQVKGELRKTFANPTPIAILGFLLSLTPLSMELMNWRGTGGAGVGSAGIGNYYFFGGMLMIFGSIGEWIMGNTFPFVVFGSFGAFWLGFAATLQPFYSAYGNYAPSGQPAAAGLATTEFLNSFAFFQIAMAMLDLIYMILALRTNVVFVGIFATLTAAFSCLAASYMYAAKGNTGAAHTCQVAGGALTFTTTMLGWYLFFVIMLAALDFPFQLPVGDLSRMIKGASERNKEKEHEV